MTTLVLHRHTAITAPATRTIRRGDAAAVRIVGALAAAVVTAGLFLAATAGGGATRQYAPAVGNAGPPSSEQVLSTQHR